MPKKEHSDGPIRSPMTRDVQANPTHRTPSTAGTTEMIPGSAPKPAPVSSPNPTKPSKE